MRGYIIDRSQEQSSLWLTTCLRAAKSLILSIYTRCQCGKTVVLTRAGGLFRAQSLNYPPHLAPFSSPTISKQNHCTFSCYNTSSLEVLPTLYSKQKSTVLFDFCFFLYATIIHPAFSRCRGEGDDKKNPQTNVSLKVYLSIVGKQGVQHF